MFRIIALAVLLVACSQDNPVVAPDEDLVGSWTVESTDLSETVLTGLERYLKDEFPNADRDAINDRIKELRQGLSDPMEDFPFTTIRFNRDGSYEDNHGGLGSWDVDGNTLIIDGEVMCRYFADGNELAFIFRLGSPPFDLPDNMESLDGSTFRFFLVRR